MVEARGVVIATVLAVCVLVGLLLTAAVTYSHRIGLDGCHEDAPTTRSDCP